MPGCGNPTCSQVTGAPPATCGSTDWKTQSGDEFSRLRLECDMFDIKPGPKFRRAWRNSTSISVAIFVNICSGVVANLKVFWTPSGPIIRQDLCSVKCRVLDNFEIVAGENLHQKPGTWLLWKTVFKMVFNHPNLLPYFIYIHITTSPLHFNSHCFCWLLLL